MMHSQEEKNRYSDDNEKQDLLQGNDTKTDTANAQL